MKSLMLILIIIWMANLKGWGEGALPTPVQEILETRCVKCHGAGDPEGGLRLDHREGMLRGGDGGPAAVVGDAARSHLIERISLSEDDADLMPPKGGRLSDHEIASISQWIADGAVWEPEQVLVARELVAKQITSDKVLRSLSVFPTSVQLTTAADFHRLIVLATYDDDTTESVGDFAEYRIGDASVAKLEGLLLTPLADGSTELSIKYRGQEVVLPIEVVEASASREVSFQLDVMPVLMKNGCNTGECHGSARGQDGFRLSLFGYDPAGDYHRLTKEISGRRLNLAIPEESLLIEKATETVAHSGGKRFDKGSEAYSTLVEWIKAGATADPKDLPMPTKIEIQPGEILLEGYGATQALSVRASYSDGTDRDVTSLAVFTSSNAPVASVDDQGKVTANARGEAFVMARFHTFTVGCQVLVIPADLQYERPTLEVRNDIDRHVYEKLHRLRILPSEICSDEVFIRRVTLDITGKLPTPAEYHAFISDTNVDKRSQLIDDLIERKDFVEIWVMKWAELLRIRADIANNVSYKATLLYFNWLKEKLTANVPLDEMVSELLTSSGGTFQNPPANYYQVERDTLKLSENVAQVFMGMRLQCAQCHDHPFDRWTMNDYYGFAAFFSQIGRKGAEDPREQIIFNRSGGAMKHPIDGRTMAPQFLGGTKPDVKGKDRRKVLADWLVSPDNPYFARNMVNIVWEHFMGIGIIDPVDDVRISNPPSNPELLNSMAEDFAESGYDFKQLVREICASDAYQRSSKVNDSNQGDTRNYAHAMIRRLRAEVLLDVISQVTEAPSKYRGLPEGARAVEIADGNVSNYFLTTFGRATRTTVCSCEVKMEPNLSQALHLLNGSSVHNSIAKGRVIPRWMEEGLSPQEVFKKLYERLLSRSPTEREMTQLSAETALAKDENELRLILEDLFWAVLNSKEFIFNH